MTRRNGPARRLRPGRYGTIGRTPQQALKCLARLRQAQRHRVGQHVVEVFGTVTKRRDALAIGGQYEALQADARSSIACPQGVLLRTRGRSATAASEVAASVLRSNGVRTPVG